MNTFESGSISGAFTADIETTPATVFPCNRDVDENHGVDDPVVLAESGNEAVRESPPCRWYGWC